MTGPAEGEANGPVVTWRPGDLVVATVDGRPDVRLVAGWSKCDPQLRWCELSPRWADGDDAECWFMPRQVTGHRRLVAIELPNGALAGWPVLIDALQRARATTGLDMTFAGLIQQIEEQTTPPKPAEPTGLGAVVEAIHGNYFVRVGDAGWSHYEASSAEPVHWEDIAVMRVLSEGVQA